VFVVSPYCSQSGVVAERCKGGKGEDSHGEDQRPEPEVFELEAASSGPTALGTAGAWRPRFGSDGFGTAFGGHWGQILQKPTVPPTVPPTIPPTTTLTSEQGWVQRLQSRVC